MKDIYNKKKKKKKIRYMFIVSNIHVSWIFYLETQFILYVDNDDEIVDDYVDNSD